MGHFFLGFDVRICSSELTHMKMIFLLPDMCTPKENNFDFFEPKSISWVRRDAWM